MISTKKKCLKTQAKKNQEKQNKTTIEWKKAQTRIQKRVK